MIGPLSYFFIRSKSYTNLTVLDFRMPDQIFHGGDNLSQACFVIGSKKGCPIRYNNILTFILKDFRKFIGIKYDFLFFVEGDIFTIIIIDDSRFYILPTYIRAGVHVGYKTDS